MMRFTDLEKGYRHYFCEKDEDSVEYKYSVDLKNGEVLFDVKLSTKTNKELFNKGYLILQK